MLPVQGRLLLEGPPGSGKTNLLLLRAQFVAGAGNKNVLIVTYTKSLADFIRSGIAATGLISPSQVKTFHSWIWEHIRDNTGSAPMEKGEEFDDDTRIKLVNAALAVNKKLPSSKLFSAIFVDEAQDLTAQELECLLVLSENICICGDVKQGIYKRDGLTVADKLGLSRHMLQAHYRIGQKIAHVADRLMPPEGGATKLEESSNYNPKVQGESSAVMHECVDRQAQFEKMLSLLRVQVDAFKGDVIGILCGKKEMLSELRTKFNSTEIAALVCVHGLDAGATFASSHPIHILSIHSAKGTEFRAVHIFGAEEMRTYPINNRQLGFTAITRAKTALNVYRTGDTNKALENAFAAPSHIDLDNLFPEQE
jgi:superfamily I DNA/RNA helicase